MSKISLGDVLSLGGAATTGLAGVAPWVGPAATVLGGALKGQRQQDKANRYGSKARDVQRAQFQMTQEQYGRLQQVTDALLALIDNAEQQGAFDPQRMIAETEKRQLEYDKLNLGNMAAAYKTLGYNPGDLEPQQGLAAATAQSQGQLHRMRLYMPLQMLAQRIALTNQAQPERPLAALGLQLNAGNNLSNAYLGAAAQAQGQVPDLGSLFQTVQPYLNKQQQAPATGGGGSFPVSTPGFNPHAENPYYYGRLVDFKPLTYGSGN